jgi:Holliday junction resolvase RusA-like endonuclease
MDWAFDLYELFGRGGDDEQMRYLDVAGDPWSKARPRFARRGAYQPRDDREAEQRLAWRMKAGGAPQFPGNVMLACRFYRSNAQRVDADNLLKHVCDSANGVLWKDDSQVTLALAELHYDPARPRTIILAGNHASTLLRGDDRQQPCAHCDELFLPLPGRREQRFCSTACAYAARTTALPAKACEQCGESFRPTTKRQILCSRECHTEWLRGRNRGRGGPMSRCTECGKELAHRRGGRCRDCWRANPNFYKTGTPPGAHITIRAVS